MLRVFELGLSMEALDNMTVGMVYDMLTEKENDTFEWPKKATQDDFDKF